MGFGSGSRPARCRGPGADQVEIVIQAPRMQVARGADQRAGVVDRELVQGRPAAIGILGHIRERELAVAPAAPLDIEDRVDVVILDVHPDRMDGGDRRRERRGRGDEVDVVGDVDLRGST